MQPFVVSLSLSLLLASSVLGCASRHRTTYPSSPAVYPPGAYAGSPRAAAPPPAAPPPPVAATPPPVAVPPPVAGPAPVAPPPAAAPPPPAPPATAVYPPGAYGSSGAPGGAAPGAVASPAPPGADASAGSAGAAAPPNETLMEKECRELRQRAAERYCPYDAPCEPKVLPPECWEDPPTRRIAAFVEGIVLRPGVYSLLGGPDPHETVSVLLSIDPDVARRGEHMNTRGMLYGALGGGSAGLEGQLEGTGTVGSHVRSRTDRGPFARLGYGFQLLGNRDLYRSHIELPRIETGYQRFGSSSFLEVQASTGVVLGGRYDVGSHGNRTIGTVPEAGASLTLQGDSARLHVSAMRIFAFDPERSTSIDQAKMDVCVQSGKATLFCAHGAAHRGEVRWRDGSISSSAALYGGATFGVGAIDVK